MLLTANGRRPGLVRGGFARTREVDAGPQNCPSPMPQFKLARGILAA
jgi:hypothetical protein